MLVATRADGNSAILGRQSRLHPRGWTGDMWRLRRKVEFRNIPFFYRGIARERSNAHGPKQRAGRKNTSGSVEKPASIHAGPPPLLHRSEPVRRWGDRPVRAALDTLSPG